MPTLTYEDQKLFTRLDEAVALGCRAAKVVIEAGRALKTIRDRQLYRDAVGTWEDYLGRHGLSRRRGDQMIAAAATLDAVQGVVLEKTGTAVPEMSERAIRPLVGLAVEDAAEAVIEAAQDADGITPATIRKAASRRKAKGKVRVPRPVRLKVAGAIVEVAVNAKGVKAGTTVEAALLAALDVVRREATEAA